MSDLQHLFSCQKDTARWKAEYENASARLELAHIKENCAYLISQHEPVASSLINREKLRLILDFIQHGNEKRLLKELEDLQELENLRRKTK